jgi:uncharacterized protein YraI
VRRSITLSFLLTLLLSACAARASGTPTPFIITATLPPTPVPSATLTPVPPTPTATVTPVDGMTTTQVNVRATPSSAGAQLGMIPPFAKVQIVGRDAGSNWYQILYADGPDGTGWITAQYVNVLRGSDTIPVVGQRPSATQAAVGATAGPTGSGTVLQQVNVRSGPGTGYDALGLLNPNDAVTLTGKDASAAWLQIVYAAAADGVGWVAATYIQSGDLDRLPIVGSSGSAAATSTPGSAPAPVTPTPAAALQDDDSAQAPAVNVVFSPLGTRTLIFSSEISAPNGDAEDWVQFTPFGASVVASLNCSGNGSPTTELNSNGRPVDGWPGLACGESKLLDLKSGESYLMSLSITAGDSLASVRYTLRIESPAS